MIRRFYPITLPSHHARLEGFMAASPLHLQRRTMLGLAAAALARARPAWADTALADPITVDSPMVVVAGPGDSEAAHWARLLQAPLAAGLMSSTTLPLRFIGGRDGVTGANQFDARAVPDGSQALLFPGTVGLAWLAGDTRVRFEASHLLPLLVAVAPGVVMLRGGLTGRTSHMPVRLACPSAPDRQAAALLALDLLNVPALPVGAAPDAASAARDGAADAVFVTGCDVPTQLRALAEAGLRPAFTIGAKLAGATAPLRGLDAPDLMDLVPDARRRDPLMQAWSGMAAASVIDVVLGIPKQSPAAAVTKWRTACDASLQSPDLSATRTTGCVRLLSGPEAANAVNAVLVSRDAQDALHRWLDTRLNWQPS
jgi:hypothetical protein